MLFCKVHEHWKVGLWVKLSGLAVPLAYTGAQNTPPKVYSQSFNYSPSPVRLILPHRALRQLAVT